MSLSDGREPGTLPLGELIDGRYRLEGVLGVGGMGCVYRACELNTEATVAIKVLLPGLAEQVDVARFAREAELTARVDAAGGLVRVHASGIHAGLPYYVMELVDGQHLGEAINAGIDARTLAGIVAGVAHTLHRCHEARIVHRDLKPSNVLVTRDGTPKVADLGLARDRDGSSLTQTGEILGTPAYMAPEQVADARQVDARTDVYALGAILYRGLCGQPPYRGGTVEVLFAISDRDPDPLPSGTDPQLVAIVTQAMAKAPRARYASAAELARDLERFLAGEAVLARPESVWSRSLRDLRRGRPRALATLATGVALLVVASVLATQLTAWHTLGQVEDWDAAHLQRWQLGLAADQTAPSSADLSQQRAALRRADRLLLPGEAAARCARLDRRLQAHDRALRALAGDALDVPPLTTERSDEDLVVDASILYARGELPAAEQRLRRVRSEEFGPARRLGTLIQAARHPDAFLRRAAAGEIAPPPGFTARVLESRYEQLSERALECAARGPRDQRAVIEALRSAGTAGAALLDAQARRSAKVEVFNRARPSWRQTLTDAARAQRARRTVAFLDECLSCEPALPPTPYLELVGLPAGLDLLSSQPEAAFDLFEALAIHGVRAPREVRSALTEHVRARLVSRGLPSVTSLLRCLRIGAVFANGYAHGSGRDVDGGELRELEAREPESQSVRFLRMSTAFQLQFRSYEDEPARITNQPQAVARVLEGRLADLAPRYRAEVLMLDSRLEFALKRDQVDRGRVVARLIEARSLIEETDKLYHSTWALEAELHSGKALTQVWERAVAELRARVAASPQPDPTHDECLTLGDALFQLARRLLGEEQRERARRLAREASDLVDPRNEQRRFVSSGKFFQIQALLATLDRLDGKLELARDRVERWSKRGATEETLFLLEALQVAIASGDLTTSQALLRKLDSRPLTRDHWNRLRGEVERLREQTR